MEIHLFNSPARKGQSIRGPRRVMHISEVKCLYNLQNKAGTVKPSVHPLRGGGSKLQEMTPSRPLIYNTLIKRNNKGFHGSILFTPEIPKQRCFPTSDNFSEVGRITSGRFRKIVNPVANRGGLKLTGRR